MAEKPVRIALIKPSRYDDDGYVIQWRRSSIPSNSLASLYAVVVDCAERRVLGEEVALEVEAYDETNSVLPMNRIRRWVAGGGPGSFVGLVGVQSNQFPRAMDIGNPLRDAGLAVVVGGFHVSGCISMLPELPPDIQAAQDRGMVLYAGECEGRLEELLRDLRAGAPKPVYDYLKDLPGMEDQPVPILPRENVKRTMGWYTSFDAGRGCPFQCSFCTIINVQGRKSRFRTADDIERIVRTNWAQGVRRFFVTDDNFARNKNWEAIFDRLIKLRQEEKLRVFLILQVDTLCHKIPNFIEKAKAAGTRRVYIGLENINPENLAGAKKKQNRIWEYREMTQAWKSQGITNYAGYIMGFANDTPERIERDIKIIMEELPIDLLQFFPLTPLPGSEDHQRLHKQGVPMDPDMNKYDLEHVVVDHPKMTRQAWSDTYWRAWDIFYTKAHMERVMRRHVANGMTTLQILAPLMWFKGYPVIEKVHPIQGGFLRRKVRTQRRSGLPLESRAVFYPRRLAEVTSAVYRWSKLYLELRAIAWKIDRDPAKLTYMDKALSPVTSEEKEDELEMMETYGDQVAGKRRPRKAA
ncbi:MAG: hypothetical protein Kilf2KO_09090 [Rhodospirillales bacterium]